MITLNTSRIGIDYISPDSTCATNSACLFQQSREFDTSYPESAVEYYSVHPRGDDTLQINSLVKLPDALLRLGYGDEDVHEIIDGNFIRHFREVWGPRTQDERAGAWFAPALFNSAATWGRGKQ